MNKTLTFLAVICMGLLGGLISAHIYVQGYFIPWKTLANPPEKPTGILAINKGVWIKTNSGDIYHHPTDEGYPFQPSDCFANCWEKHKEAPIDEDFLYPVENCRLYVPSTNKFTISKPACKNFGPANILIIYGINDDGNISYWQHPIGDTDRWAYFMFPIPAMFFAILCYALWVLIILIRNKIKSRRQMKLE